MSCNGNNATPPSPAIAPGAEAIDPARAALELAARFPDGVDPRIRAHLPSMDAPFFQAGLAGYSDAAMRIIARRNGAPLCVTEALLDRMLLGGGRGFDKADLALQDEHLLHANLPTGHEDHPLVGQIIGSDPDEMAAAALKMIEQGTRHARHYRDMAYGSGKVPAYVDTRWRIDPDAAVTAPPAGGGAAGGGAGAGAGCDEDDAENPCGVDLSAAASPVAQPAASGQAGGKRREPTRVFAAMDVNLACPVKKIDRKSRGGHWLRDPEGATAILKAVRAAVPAHIPCTVKLRRAYDDTPEMARNFEVIFARAYELGYAWTTVHARTVEQKYIGPSRWTFLKDLVARHPDKPVFGSGDVWEVGDIFRMIAYAGVSGVSVARGCIGNPWIFRQARDLLAGRPLTQPTLAQQREVLWQHFGLSVAINGEKAAGKLMRKFGIKFAQHHPTPEAVKARMVLVNSTADWLAALNDLYPAPALTTA
ncbi:MAG: tRNA dihydrouridine synthase [bacterium]|jgi:tRNA-dihydrouridine synthase